MTIRSDNAKTDTAFIMAVQRKVTRMPLTIPLIRRLPFTLMVSSLEDMGVNTDRLLSRNNVPEWQYGNAEDMVPLYDLIRGFEIGARAIGSEEFGLLLAKRFEISKFGNYGATIAASMTVFEAMRTACTLAPKEATTARYWLVPRPDGYLFCRKQLMSTPETDHGLRQLEQYSLELIAGIVRLGAGPGWQSSEVGLSTLEKRFPKNQRQFDPAAIRYETSHSAIFVPSSLLALPVHRKGSVNAKNGKLALNASMADENLCNAVVDVLRSGLKLGVRDLMTVASVAELAGLSKRTFQRRLAQYGSSFQRLFDRARYQTTMELVVDSTISIADIADSAGYEHPQHFIYAFKRWTGLTPGQYRKAKPPIPATDHLDHQIG